MTLESGYGPRKLPFTTARGTSNWKTLKYSLWGRQAPVCAAFLRSVTVFKWKAVRCDTGLTQSLSPQGSLDARTIVLCLYVVFRGSLLIICSGRKCTGRMKGRHPINASVFIQTPCCVPREIGHSGIPSWRLSLFGRLRSINIYFWCEGKQK